MAGRVPVGWQREAVAPAMEDAFVHNLRYAADLLAQVGHASGGGARGSVHVGV